MNMCISLIKIKRAVNIVNFVAEWHVNLRWLFDTKDILVEE